jgi:hypothetical protein
MDDEEAQQHLEALGASLERRGFRWRGSRGFFAKNGIWAYTPPTPQSVASGTPVMERTVFLYRVGDQWTARVTQHGGPHWIKRAKDLRELEAIAIDVLAEGRQPPSDDSWEEE